MNILTHLAYLNGKFLALHQEPFCLTLGRIEKNALDLPV